MIFIRILIIEDECTLAETIKEVLKKHNYIVDISNDGLEGYENALSNIYDLILLDVMLPNMDGFTILKSLREENISTKVILLTAKSDVLDKVNGLDIGADDYLSKPFEMVELLARIKANLRRNDTLVLDNILSFNDIKLDVSNLLLIKDNNKLKITLKEAQLLELLILRKDSNISKELILEKIWGYDSNADYNHIEVYISFLRKKLKYLKADVSIKTTRNIGYMLKEKVNV